MPDQGSEGLLSPYLRKRRIKAALPYISGRVLDVGCGSGEMASFILTENYLGVDIDEESLIIAKRKYPLHLFQHEMPPVGEQFDCVISLAVIEHVDDPLPFLETLAKHLKSGSESNIVLTSPNPIAGRLHNIGSRIGLFSRSGNEEHERLLNYSDFMQLAVASGLDLKLYQRFLLGMNQLVIYQKEVINL